MKPYKMKCPRCGKRACDICVNNTVKTTDFFIELKCPNCKNIVRIQYPITVSLVKEP